MVYESITSLSSTRSIFKMYIEVPIAKMKIGRIIRNGMMSDIVTKISFMKNAVVSKRRSKSFILIHMNKSITETITLLVESSGQSISMSVITVMNPFNEYMVRSKRFYVSVICFQQCPRA